MDWKHAVRYCENHECKECPIYNLNLDKRTLQEKQNQHVPCCENLVDNIIAEQYIIRMKQRI
jgi:hypothetical protein